ncbi:MAG: glycoside hydrolase family 3 N-terminal domain-containing protein [Bacilli bacterium]
MSASIYEKMGQMIMIGLDAYKINDEIRKLIKDYKIGGVVLYKSNYKDIKSMVSFINELKKINGDNVPLFIAIDQENGRVNRLPDEITRIYNPLRQAKTGDIDIVNKCNEITAKILSDVGVNMNLAPLVDINYNSDNTSIGNRSYGDKEAVIKYGLPMIEMMKKHGIISVVKHFPGHGLVKTDSHYLIPVINDVSLMEDDLEIYDKAISNGADAIMIGHLKVCGYGSKPASINKEIIDKYLIKKYDYKGLIITDDLRMNTMKYMYGIKNVISKSIEAKNNILMIKYKKGDIKKVYNELYKMIDKGKIDKNLINNSYEKIINFKNKYKLSNDIKDGNIDIDEINKEIIDVNSKM